MNSITNSVTNFFCFKIQFKIKVIEHCILKNSYMLDILTFAAFSLCYKLAYTSRIYLFTFFLIKYILFFLLFKVSYTNAFLQ